MANRLKAVSKERYVGELPDKYYQYTVIDEDSREHFIYTYKEQFSYSTIDFVKRTIVFLGINLKLYKLIMTKNLLTL